MTRVLCIAAHPDDEVLGVGGTLLKHKAAGDDVRIVLLHKCSARGWDEQHEQAAESARRLGIPVEWQIPLDLDRYVAEYRPDIVYTHSAADLHREHQDTHHRALVACRPQSGVKALYAFETPCATDWSGVPFIPQRFVDIVTTLPDKLYAMEAYESELRDEPHPRNITALANRARYWGSRVGVYSAEAFEVIRECA